MLPDLSTSWRVHILAAASTERTADSVRSHYDFVQPVPICWTLQVRFASFKHRKLFTNLLLSCIGHSDHCRFRMAVTEHLRLAKQRLGGSLC